MGGTRQPLGVECEAGKYESVPAAALPPATQTRACAQCTIAKLYPMRSRPHTRGAGSHSVHRIRARGHHLGERSREKSRQSRPPSIQSVVRGPGNGNVGAASTQLGIAPDRSRVASIATDRRLCPAIQNARSKGDQPLIVHVYYSTVRAALAALAQRYYSTVLYGMSTEPSATLTSARDPSTNDRAPRSMQKTPQRFHSNKRDTLAYCTVRSTGDFLNEGGGESSDLIRRSDSTSPGQ